MDGIAEVGSYWSPEVQIDVVAIRDDGWIELGECKWGAVRSPKALVEQLERKVPHYPDRRGSTIVRRLFTRAAVRAPTSSPAATWHDLEDLYADA